MIAANRARLNALESPSGVAEGTRLQAVHNVDVYRFTLAFDGDRSRLGDLEDASDKLVCSAGDQNSTLGCIGFQALGQIYRIANRRIFADRSHSSQQGGPGIDPDPQLNVLDLGSITR